MCIRDRANPIVDTRLPDGSRVNVVLPPISLVGPVVTIRKFSKNPMTIEKLIEYGSLTRPIADFLEILVKARYNIFVCGGTGSGKTTFLNALSNYIPKDERIITIEDSAELQIENVPNLVSLETRNANSAGAGAITIRDLIKSSLRMRPERIIVGEVRGAEALDMLQAMNTGHDGSLSTGHANSTRDMLSRLETMVLQGAAGLPLAAIRQQISSAVDIICLLYTSYSVQGGSGKSVLSYALAAAAARSGKQALYISLDPFPALGQLYEHDFSGTIDDLLFALKGGRDLAPVVLDSMERNADHVMVLPPFHFAGDLLSLKQEELNALIRVLVEKTDLEYIFLDLPTGIQTMNLWALEQCSSVLQVYTDDLVGRERMQRVDKDVYFQNLPIHGQILTCLLDTSRCV